LGVNKNDKMLMVKSNYNVKKIKSYYNLLILPEMVQNSIGPTLNRVGSDFSRRSPNHSRDSTPELTQWLM